MSTSPADSSTELPFAEAVPHDPVASGSVPDDEHLEEEHPGHEELAPSPWRSRLRGLGACAISTIVHMIGLIILSLCMIAIPDKPSPQTIVALPVDTPKDEELEEIQLDPEMMPATEMTSPVSSSPMSGMSGALAGSPAEAAELDAKVVEKFSQLDNNFSIEHPLADAPSSKTLIEEMPEGALGESRMIIDNYNQAFDVITQEIMWMLDRSDVLVVWCFDQSESMKDDQKEIRDRVQKVYVELGLARRPDDAEHLLTGVASYGKGYQVHTSRPTGDYQKIREAIDAVPEDPSGKEMMCQAVGETIRRFRKFAKGRQMALILVTDESGNQDNNETYLEATIAEAKAAKCKIYTLGREAVFGYRYAHRRWKHPQTRRVHWLPMDRGPESGYVEQLQTNGFRRRHDAFGSGFGPYEQARMSRETGGIFFMLPSVESNLVRGHKRRYELEVLRAYKPDLRSRQEAFLERDETPLRTFLWRVIQDLNPHNPNAKRSIEMRMGFSLRPDQFLTQARKEQVKALRFIGYLGEVQKILEDQAASYRAQEADPRWQANYDLIYAQVVAYQARLYEYGVALEHFIQDPQTAPMTRSPNLHLSHWDIAHQKEIREPEKSQPYIDRASELFQAVIDEHPGTPWAERAQVELRRGFGVKLVPDYDPPAYSGTPSPVPKL